MKNIYFKIALLIAVAFVGENGIAKGLKDLKPTQAPGGNPSDKETEASQKPEGDEEDENLEVEGEPASKPPVIIQNAVIENAQIQAAKEPEKPFDQYESAFVDKVFVTSDLGMAWVKATMGSAKTRGYADFAFGKHFSDTKIGMIPKVYSVFRYTPLSATHEDSGRFYRGVFEIYSAGIMGEKKLSDFTQLQLAAELGLIRSKFREVLSSEEEPSEKKQFGFNLLASGAFLWKVLPRSFMGPKFSTSFGTLSSLQISLQVHLMF